MEPTYLPLLAAVPEAFIHPVGFCLPCSNLKTAVSRYQDREDFFALFNDGLLHAKPATFGTKFVFKRIDAVLQVLKLWYNRVVGFRAVLLSLQRHHETRILVMSHRDTSCLFPPHRYVFIFLLRKNSSRLSNQQSTLLLHLFRWKTWDS